MSILIVDDSDDMRLSTRTLLEMAGYADIMTAPSAQAAFQLLGVGGSSATPPQVDVILMDVMMPQMDGIEACRQLKAQPRFRDIPIIMVTGRTEDGDLAAAFAAGVSTTSRNRLRSWSCSPGYARPSPLSAARRPEGQAARTDGSDPPASARPTSGSNAFRRRTR